jgi:hypothetical protein
LPGNHPMIVKEFGSAKDFRPQSANFLHAAKSLHSLDNGY